MTDWQLTPAEQLLCDCVQVSDPEKQSRSARQLLDTLGTEEAFRFAVLNEVASHVAHGLSDNLPGNFGDKHQSVERRMTLLMNELDRVAELLAAQKIPLVALKNAGIARGIYRCLGCSPMGDLDVMVRREDFRKAHDVLVEDGYQFEFRSALEENDIEEAARSGGTEYWRTLPDGTKVWLELQWRPVAGRWIQPDQEPDGDDLMDRSDSIDGSKVRLLAPEDNLMQVALHTAKHTYVRAPGFRLHTDVDRIVVKQDVDWAPFVATGSLGTALYGRIFFPQDSSRHPRHAGTGRHIGRIATGPLEATAASPVDPYSGLI